VNVASALQPLLALPGVEQAAADARTDLDALLWNRTLKAQLTHVRPEVVARSVRATAALEGADVSLASVRSGAAVDGSPMGRVVAAAQLMQAELPSLVGVARTAPAQAWARLAAIAGAGFAADDELGRPRSDDVVSDPLNVGLLPPAVDVLPRIQQLSLISLESDAPAVVVSGVVHAELLGLRPFKFGNGLVARAAARLVLAVRGVDVDFLAVPESGLLGAGRPTYATVARGYLDGGADGVARSLVLWCAALHEGALETANLANSLIDSEPAEDPR